MELKEFMGVFRPINNDIKFFAGAAGVTEVHVQMAATIEEEVRKFAVAMKNKFGKKRKHKIQNFRVPERIVNNLRELVDNLPKTFFVL